MSSMDLNTMYRTAEGENPPVPQHHIHHTYIIYTIYTIYIIYHTGPVLLKRNAHGSFPDTAHSITIFTQKTTR